MLNGHIESVNEGKKQFECTICSETLKKHIASVHEGIKPLKCTFFIYLKVILCLFLSIHASDYYKRIRMKVMFLKFFWRVLHFSGLPETFCHSISFNFSK